jgi:hypothetical protein
VPEINPFLQTPCQVTAPFDAISFIRFIADSDDHSLQPRESVNTTSPAFASAGLPFDALPVFCPAACATGTRATRAPIITIHSLPDITILVAISAKPDNFRTVPTVPLLRFREKTGKYPAAQMAIPGPGRAGTAV